MSGGSRKNPVHFVGAGPGDPGLLTVKARRLLDRADLVIYAGSLVPKAVVEGIGAELMDSAGMHLEEITGAMIAAWKEGKRVVRLHTGDPAVFGAIGEQMAVLRREGVPFRLVPGVSSVAAAAAALSAELTLPEVSQTVIITRRGGRTPVPEKESLAELARHRATMMILLSVGMIEEVAKELMAAGYPGGTPAAVVEKASWPRERVIRGALADIAEKTRAAEIKKTAIIAVGEVFREADPEHLSRLYDKNFSHAGRRSGGDAAPPKAKGKS